MRQSLCSWPTHSDFRIPNNKYCLCIVVVLGLSQAALQMLGQYSTILDFLNDLKQIRNNAVTFSIVISLCKLEMNANANRMEVSKLLPYDNPRQS